MKKAVHEGLLFSCCQKAPQKHGWYPSQSVLRASQNQAAALNRRKILCQPCSCRPGMRAHAVCGWYPCFCDGLSYFLRICRIRFASPAPGEREEKIRSLYTGIFDFFLSKLHSGRNYRDIHDRWEIESFHGKRPHFSLHTFILHKPLLFTTSPQKIFYSASPSFRSERSGEIILQNGASSWLLKLLNCKRIMMAAPFYWRGAFLYKTNAYNLWFQL